MHFNTILKKKIWNGSGKNIYQETGNTVKIPRKESTVLFNTGNQSMLRKHEHLPLQLEESPEEATTNNSITKEFQPKKLAQSQQFATLYWTKSSSNVALNHILGEDWNWNFFTLPLTHPYGFAKPLKNATPIESDQIKNKNDANWFKIFINKQHYQNFITLPREKRR